MPHTISTAFYDLKAALQPLYEAREAEAVAHEFLHHLTGLSRTERLMRKEELLSADQQQAYDAGTAALISGKPLQQVTHSAWFMGREYYVNEDVLIPRPETEELVQWIISDQHKAPHILDIGTGSGCIPISLKLAIPASTVTAIDVSAGALAVAQRNAATLAADITLRQINFLKAAQQAQLGTYNVIVSNPPYIPIREHERLHPNVRDHEPHMALFVPDDDALVFYRAIARFGRTHLQEGGYIYCELDADHALETQALFESEGYSHVETRKDMHGNWRMLKASR